MELPKLKGHVTGLQKKFLHHIPMHSLHTVVLIPQFISAERSNTEREKNLTLNSFSTYFSSKSIKRI
jgi:hypothetical protein